MSTGARLSVDRACFSTVRSYAQKLHRIFLNLHSSRNIYREKVTGARADRRELNRMLGKLPPATW